MTEYDNNFYDEHDFIECLSRGCEVEFLYNEKRYSITHTGSGISVIEFYNPDSERTYESVNELLCHKFGVKMLKEILPDMKIIDRSF